MTNNGGDNHPVHLHRHTFEVTRVADKATAGVMKEYGQHDEDEQP
jgi:hypothetical protein